MDDWRASTAWAEPSNLMSDTVCEDDAKGLVRELSGDSRADAENTFRVRQVSYCYMLVDPSPGQ